MYFSKCGRAIQKRPIDKTKGKEAVKPDEFEYITVKIFLSFNPCAGNFPTKRLTHKPVALSESELIKNLQSGSESAFRELVALYQDKVYNTVLGFIQQEDEAEDVTQEVFIRIYRSVAAFRQEASLSTWIYRIAVTQSLDQLRKNRRRFSGLVSGFQSKQQEVDFVHPGVKAEQRESSALLFKSIRRLPENQKTAFLLQKLEGLSHHEIAAIMKSTVSSVESLLHRAKQNLRKSLIDIDKHES